MLNDLLQDPDSCAAHGRTLAELHRRLDRVPAPAEFRLPTPAGRPGRLLHGDLHPGNVLLSDRGPVIVDWTDAGSGPSAHDTATTWLVLACLDAQDPGERAGVAAVRRPLLDAFLDGVDRAAAAAAMPAVATRRLADGATTDVERTRIRALLAVLDPA
jgi:Ser/Thr protein kinase RdoA (MazF antagonist)